MFQRKQFHFLINSTRIPGQASIRSYYAVTWNDDGDLIMPHCTAYRLRGHTEFAIKSSTPPVEMRSQSDAAAE